MESSTLEVLSNSTYGGFGISDAAYDKYKEKNGKLAKWDTDIRYDPILIDIFKKDGAEFVNRGCSSIILETISKIYKDYHTIDEYDGLESININKDGYDRNLLIEMREQIKIILYDPVKTDSQKVAEISRIIY